MLPNFLGTYDCYVGKQTREPPGAEGNPTNNRFCSRSAGVATSRQDALCASIVPRLVYRHRSIARRLLGPVIDEYVTVEE